MPQVDEGLIHAWIDGQLPADEAARVEALVASSPEWAAAVAEARGFVAASSRILSALDHQPAGVAPASATPAGVAPRITKRGWSRDVKRVLPMAATFAVMIAGSIWLAREWEQGSAPTLAESGSVLAPDASEPTQPSDAGRAVARVREEVQAEAQAQAEARPEARAQSYAKERFVNGNMPLGVLAAQADTTPLDVQDSAIESGRVALIRERQAFCNGMAVTEYRLPQMEGKRVTMVAGVVGDSVADWAKAMACLASESGVQGFQPAPRVRRPSRAAAAARTQKVQGSTEKAAAPQVPDSLRWIDPRTNRAYLLRGSVDQLTLTRIKASLDPITSETIDP